MASVGILVTLAVHVVGSEEAAEFFNEFEDMSRLLTDVSDDNATNTTNETVTTTITETTTATTTMTTTGTTTVTTTTTLTTIEEKVTTVVNIGLSLEDATTFDEEAFIAELASATGVDPSDIVITRTTYTVEVGYEISGTLSEEVARSAVAAITGVPAENVEVVVNVNVDGRRLDTRIDAIITAATAAQTQDIKGLVADTDAIVAAVQEATGETVTLTVVRAPQAVVVLVTEVAQTASQASSTPINTENLADVGTALGGTIVVTDPNNSGGDAAGAAGGTAGGSAGGSADGADGTDGADGASEPSAATFAGAHALTIAMLLGLAVQRI